MVRAIDSPTRSSTWVATISSVKGEDVPRERRQFFRQRKREVVVDQPSGDKARRELAVPTQTRPDFPARRLDAERPRALREVRLVGQQRIQKSERPGCERGLIAILRDDYLARELVAHKDPLRAGVLHMSQTVRDRHGRIGELNELQYTKRRSPDLRCKARTILGLTIVADNLLARDIMPIVESVAPVNGLSREDRIHVFAVP